MAAEPFRRGSLNLAVEAAPAGRPAGPERGPERPRSEDPRRLAEPSDGRVLNSYGLDPAAGPRDRRAKLVAYLPPPGEVGKPASRRQVAALGRISRRPGPADLTPEDYGAAEAALDRFGVAGLSARPFDQLSSGERQLVLLARTVLQDARLCILDEPSATLDPAHRRAVATAIRGLSGRAPPSCSRPTTRAKPPTRISVFCWETRPLAARLRRP
jgi:hypothetical protein